MVLFQIGVLLKKIHSRDDDTIGRKFVADIITKFANSQQWMRRQAYVSMMFIINMMIAMINESNGVDVVNGDIVDDVGDVNGDDVSDDDDVIEKFWMYMLLIVVMTTIEVILMVMS